MTMKVCTKCGIEKPLAGFNTHKPPRRGTYSHCKECRSVNEKAYRAANAERISAKRKAHRAANPERYRTRHQAYYQANAERISARNKAAYDANPEPKRRRNKERLNQRRALDPDSFANRRLKLHYGITLDDYNHILDNQGGLCANPGCFNEPPADRRFDVDHDHSCCSGAKSCGKCVRGLLCRRCNQSLGILQEDPKRIQGLVDYLERYR